MTPSERQKFLIYNYTIGMMACTSPSYDAVKEDQILFTEKSDETEENENQEEK